MARRPRRHEPEEDPIVSSADQTLLADIGGTNARFALLADGVLGPIEHVRVADHPDVGSAIAHVLGRHAGGGAIRAATLGVAAAVENNRCRVLNSDWIVAGDALAARFGFATVRLLNDFEALAWSLPLLTGADICGVGGGRALAGAPIAVIGPGTGLGTACFVPGDRPMAIAAEAGHATLPGTSPREDAVIDRLRRRFGHASAERALSGGGLQNLYEAIAAVDGVGVPPRDATAICAAAREASCPVSEAALAMFCAMLGTVAGNLALTFRARGGVFIAGGMVPRFADTLARSEFRARFEAKGRYRAWLEAIPTSVIMRPDSAFLGLRAFTECAAIKPARRHAPPIRSRPNPPHERND
jgi:glucokinase